VITTSPLRWEAATIVRMKRDNIFILSNTPLEEEGRGEDGVRRRVKHYKH
jgi:hypothetical protein